LSIHSDTDNQDGGGTDQAHRRVRPVSTQCDGDGTDEHQQRGDTVCADMDAKSLQCCRTDAATHPNAVLSHHFVAHGANDRSNHHDGEVRDLLGMD
jgi:hypothetical protein